MVTGPRGLSIGRMAAAAGVNLETVRYYERIGLMPPPDRTEGGHRAYDAAHVRRLAFIRHARALGFGIEDIRTLLALSAPGHRSCRDVRDIASAHLSEVRTKLAHLARLERILGDTVDQCSGAATPVCPVLDMLDAPI
ncbi:MAG: helix-turn-helix domain-containing protein [Methylobacterium sp.]|uniref:MerR family transcriptional regulator n=1 Tax=Methylobacterium sp. TaxID=409 RepID=UPI0025F3E077|nr:helix-turn-helix domain-containing protein [Methylobacterium sp.]MBX9933463.1 helix-turn-helix domain-containing protein [Methylobacterium sp.]